MRDLLDALERWHRDGVAAVLGRVVALEGSGPRLPGAAMAVSAEGEVVGSVSGGCVEGAVVEAAEALLAGGGDGALVSFGFSDDEAFAVGLTCGGTVRLFLEVLAGGGLDPGGPAYPVLAAALRAGRPVAVATVVDGPGRGRSLVVGEAVGDTVVGTLGDADLDRVVGRDAAGALAAGTTGVRHYGPQGQAGEEAVTAFVESFAPPPRLVVFGAVDFTGALVRLGRLLGYRVTVCDARAVFATPARFPEADEVVVDWPHRYLAGPGADLGPRDALCVLTHDHKFDVPAIVAALGTDVGYLGVMGSRRTHAARLERLRAEGVDDAALARVMAPIGLDLGARTPEETAVAICAEIIACRTGRPAPSLRDGDGPIHPPSGVRPGRGAR